MIGQKVQQKYKVNKLIISICSAAASRGIPGWYATHNQHITVYQVFMRNKIRCTRSTRVHRGRAFPTRLNAVPTDGSLRCRIIRWQGGSRAARKRLPSPAVLTHAYRAVGTQYKSRPEGRLIFFD